MSRFYFISTAAALAFIFSSATLQADAAIHEIGYIDTPSEAHHIVIRDGIAYVTDYEAGLRVIDVSDPTNPVEIGWLDTPGQARGIRIIENFAYIADGTAGIRIVDISNPRSPRSISYLGVGDIIDVELSGDFVFASDYEGGLRVIDISDRDNLRQVIFLDTPGESIYMTLIGTTIYLTDGPSGIHLIDVSEPIRPYVIGTCNTPGYAFQVAVREEYAYVADGIGLAVLDISDPRNPALIGTCNTSGTRQGGIDLLGRFAFISAWEAGLKVIDIDDKSNPREVDSLDTPAHAIGILLKDGIAYIGDRESGLRILDISDYYITLLHVPADYESIQAAIDAAQEGDTVLVADGTYTGEGNRNLFFHGKAITVQSVNGPETCIIDCERQNPGVTFNTDEGNGSIFRGFTIYRGGATIMGGGIYVARGCHPQIENCIIDSCATTGDGTYAGGGICIGDIQDRNDDGGITYVRNCIIRRCSGKGISGLSIIAQRAYIDDCVIEYNYHPEAFAAIGNGWDCIGEGRFRNCIIRDNEQGMGGGTYGLALYCGSPAYVAENCVIYGNTSPDESCCGLGVQYGAARNCTIYGNTSENGRAVALYDGGTLTNCIVFGNNVANQVENTRNGGAATYNDIQGGYEGEGNIDADPLFVDPDNGDFHLTWENYPIDDETKSPCIDAGDPESPEDPDGTRADMGAYYYNQLRDQPEVSWCIDIAVSAGNCHDNENCAGGAEGATFEFDVEFDIPEPPHAPSNFISLYFPHPEWEQIFENFTTDVVPEDAWMEGQIVWGFEVNTDQANESVIMIFSPSELPGDNQPLVLEDIAIDSLQNLLIEGTYEYNSGEGGIRDFRLHFAHRVGVMVIQPNGGELIRGGEIAEINWEAESLGDIQQSIIYFSLDRGETWEAIDSTYGNDFDQEEEVPADLYSPYSLIRVVCSDEFGVMGQDESDDIFYITPALMEKGFAAGWSMLSLPLNPDDPNIDAVFGDDFGDTYFYIFGYRQQDGFSLVDEVSSCAGYWLAAYDNVTVDEEGTANMGEITLDLDQGWNLLGDCYPWPTPLNSVLVQTEDTTYTFPYAAEAGLVQNILYTMQAPGNEYSEGQLLEPWFGYWFMALEDGLQLIVHPVVPDGDEIEGRDEIDEGTPQRWRLNIVAEIDGAADRITALGADTSATDGFDAAFDYPEPPAPPSGNYVTAYFQHEDWNPIVGSRYNRDIKRALELGESRSWTLTVETEDTCDVTLSWPEIENTIPQFPDNPDSEYRFILEDLATGQRVSMRDTESYIYHSEGEREFCIFVEALGLTSTPPVNSPDRFAIVSAYPNPFNSILTITYALPTNSYISLAVYDLSGRNVVTLVEGQKETGYHEVNWNSSNLATGIYLVRMEASGFGDVKKVMLIK